MYLFETHSEITSTHNSLTTHTHAERERHTDTDRQAQAQSQTNSAKSMTSAEELEFLAG